MLLLDENKELHLMVTNSLKQDMNHKQQVCMTPSSNLNVTRSLIFVLFDIEGSIFVLFDIEVAHFHSFWH